MSRAKKTKELPPTPPPTLVGTVKSLVELLRRSNCPRPRQYVQELAWLFFLRFLDDQQIREAEEAEAQGVPFVPVLAEPNRWRDWAAPEAAPRQGRKTRVLKLLQQMLVPALKALSQQVDATPRQRAVAEIAPLVERSRIDNEQALLEILDAVHAIGRDSVDASQLFTLDPETFTLTDVFDELLSKLNGKASEGGQVPREVIRAMLRAVDFKLGQTIYDPECGTASFLVEAGEFLRTQAGTELSASDRETLQNRTLFGREKSETLYPIGVANLTFHGHDERHIARGSVVMASGEEEGILEGAPESFECVLMNPSTEVREDAAGLIPEVYSPMSRLLEHVLQRTHSGSRCGFVLDDRVLRDTTAALASAKRRWLAECDVYGIVRLPESILSSTDGVVNLVFFDKGRPTERIWYYDLPENPAGKKAPIALEHFDELFRLLPERTVGERSWTVDFATKRDAALREAQPLREAATVAKAQADKLEVAAAEVRQQQEPAASEEEIQAIEQQRDIAQRDAREAEAKAAEIENRAYNLHSLNPNAPEIVEEDNDRRMVELLDQLEEQSRVVDDVLARMLDFVRGSGVEEEAVA